MKNLLCKECEVCGTKISKLQSLWNILLLKTGEAKMECKKCGTQYRAYKIISWIGLLYDYSFVWILVLLYIASFYEDIGMGNGAIEWVYTIPTYILLEFIVMVFIPLTQIKEKKE